VLWSIETGAIKAQLAGHASDVYDLLFVGETSLLASAGRDRTVRIWDAKTGELRAVLRYVSGSTYFYATERMAKARKSESRSLTPRVLLRSGGRAYLTAYGPIDCIEKTYRLDRIREMSAMIEASSVAAVPSVSKDSRIPPEARQNRRDQP
jgi:WD40 repeat protein